MALLPKLDFDGARIVEASKSLKRRKKESSYSRQGVRAMTTYSLTVSLDVVFAFVTRKLFQSLIYAYIWESTYLAELQGLRVICTALRTTDALGS
jgi:hypothetical protein